MNRIAIAGCAIAALALNGCTTADPQTRGALRGGGIGAAAGALAALVIPGFPVLAGLAVGGVGGAGIGAATAKGGQKHYQHDERGRYYIDRNGNRVYEGEGAAAAPPAAPAEQVPAGG
jgi:osmotically inducible lipoprotein OsmB